MTAAWPAALDRCPHRAVPLSGGTLQAGMLICPYHGWTFATDGRCLSVPGSDIAPNIWAKAFPTETRGGLIWIGPLDIFGPVIWPLANGLPQPEEHYDVTVRL